MTAQESEVRTTKRVAVVTGGAAGIGQAYALRLAQDGHAVAIGDQRDGMAGVGCGQAIEFGAKVFVIVGGR